MTWLLGFFGVPGIIEQVLRIVNTSLGIASPALTGAFELAVWFIKVLWNGILDIVDSWMTVLTVMTIVLGTWAYAKFPKDPRLAICQAQVETLQKKQQQKAPRAPQETLKWPWEYLF